MKHLLLLLGLTLIVSTAEAQPAAMRSDTRGVFLGLHLNGTSWTIDDLDVKSESGGGLGVMLGYGVSRVVTIYAAGDGARISPDEGDTYTLGHFDLGVQVHFLSTANPARPFVDLALSGRAAQFDAGLVTFDATGAGFTFGGGLKYFFSLPLALDAGAKVTVGKFNKLRVGDLRGEIDVNATSVRIKLGLVWFPGK